MTDIFDEILVFPVMCTDPFTDGGSIFMRLGISHRVEGCNWSVAFEGVPSSAIQASRIIAELEMHKLSCVPPKTKTQIPDWLNHVGPGWHELLMQLDEDIRALGADYTTIQVKQKFGALRAYLDYQDPAVGDLIKAATVKSAHTCEDCGQPGFIRNRNDRGKWMECLCDTCVRMERDPW